MVMHPVACAQGGGVVGVRPGGWYKLQGQWASVVSAVGSR